MIWAFEKHSTFSKAHSIYGDANSNLKIHDHLTAPRAPLPQHFTQLFHHGSTVYFFAFGSRRYCTHRHTVHFYFGSKPRSMKSWYAHTENHAGQTVNALQPPGDH